jgi:hypothetical protein
MTQTQTQWPPGRNGAETTSEARDTMIREVQIPKGPAEKHLTESAILGIDNWMHGRMNQAP